MSMPSEIKDGYLGTQVGAAVTKRGQLVTAPLEFGESYQALIDVNNEVENFIVPKANWRFVLTDFLISADRNVSTAGTLVQLYESDGPDSATQLRNIFTVDVGRSTVVPLTGLNLILNEGVWLNATADDTNVYLTVIGYYVEA